MEKAALKGDGARFALPRPLMGDKRLDFSFSGLKTAVRHAAEAASPLSGQDVCDLAASFQEAVADTLNDRVSRSLAKFRERFPDMANPALVVAGGVAANKRLRAALEILKRKPRLPLHRAAYGAVHRQCRDDRLGWR